MNIQWYPGHMTKTRRQMAEYIKQVDAVCEVVDARIPQVSRNPDMDEIAAGRPRMMILNRIDLADPNKTAVWAKHFRDQGMAVIQTDSPCQAQARRRSRMRCARCSRTRSRSGMKRGWSARLSA